MSVESKTEPCPWISSKFPASLVRFMSSRSRTPAVLFCNDSGVAELEVSLDGEAAHHGIGNSMMRLKWVSFISALALVAVTAESQQPESQAPKERLTRTKVVRRFDSNENIR